jgi:hypothetical protein
VSCGFGGATLTDGVVACCGTLCGGDKLGGSAATVVFEGGVVGVELVPTIECPL